MGTTVNMAMSISSMPPSSTNSPAWQSASCAHTSRMDDVDTRMMIASMDINVPTLINVSCTFHCSVSQAGGSKGPFTDSWIFSGETCRFYELPNGHGELN